MGLSSTLWAAVSGPPAGNYLVNVSTVAGQVNQKAYMKTLYWADGSTQTTAGAGSGASALGVNLNSVSVTSPTAQINFVGSGVNVTANGSTATVTISGGSAGLPFPAGATNYIQTSSVLQAGATFYVSSATVAGPLKVRNPFSTQIAVDNSQTVGNLTSGIDFSVSGNSLGRWEQNNANFLCSDLSTVCASQPMIYDGSDGSGKFIIDQNARVGIGQGVTTPNMLTVWGGTLIGLDYPSISTAPTNGLRVEGGVKFDSIASGTQCLHADANGYITGTGSDCGSGGSTNGTIVASPQFRLPYYSTSGTTTTVTGASGITTDGAGGLVVSTITMGSASSVSGPSGSSAFNGGYAIIRTSGTSQGLIVDSRGVPAGGGQAQAGAVTIRNDANPGAPASTLLVLVDSTTDAQSGTAMLDMYSLNSNHNDPLIWIHRTSGNSSPEMRWDSPTPNLETVATSSDNAHGRGKWEPYATPFQSEILQVNSRAWDNTTFENIAYWEPLSIQPSFGKPGLYLRAQDLTNDSAVLASSNTSAVNFFTQNNHTIGITGPLNVASGSWRVRISSTIPTAGTLIYMNGADSTGDYPMSYTQVGTSGQFLQSNGAAAPTWATPSGGGSSIYAATATASFPFGASFSTITISGVGAGELDLSEGSAPTVSVSTSILYADSTSHALMLSNNGGTFGKVSTLNSTQTWTGQNNWTTPAQSTFTYGVTVGSLTVAGTGYPAFIPTDGNSYRLNGTSSTVTVGHLAVYSSTNGTTIDGGVPGSGGTPSGSSGQLQYNNGGSFAGSANTFVTSSSVTFTTVAVSTMAVNTSMNINNVNTANFSGFSTFKISSGTFVIDGTGAPTNAQALCLSGGQLGHCTSAVGAGGACTCTAP